MKNANSSFDPLNSPRAFACPASRPSFRERSVSISLYLSPSLSLSLSLRDRQWLSSRARGAAHNTQTARSGEGFALSLSLRNKWRSSIPTSAHVCTCVARVPIHYPNWLIEISPAWQGNGWRFIRSAILADARELTGLLPNARSFGREDVLVRKNSGVRGKGAATRWV